ncbi:phospholipid scramblase 2 [Tetranychus urticae]|uniref:Phospholipid scramblase n=1 Tax=Tetranychus urticae TaxID=32264 RepID=T1K9R6_TETUR|nr:phospholipid scramblase 2 [Tetranychus urticae]XP_015784559.1 phospholipid scramblase 2 [Tetranychus urticae]
MSTTDLLSDDPLHAYDGAKNPSLQLKEQNSDAKPSKTEDNWMPLPLASNCPPGLEYLTKLDKFYVVKDENRRESNNTYHIKNDSAQKVYTAVEDYDKCCLICCNITRPFDIRVLDFQKREVLHFHRPLRCQSCWCPCCLQSVEVTASGNLCGFIKQSWSLFVSKFRICDATGKTVLLIKGPYINQIVTKFQILSSDGKTEVGNVSALRAVALQEQFADVVHFSSSFPMNLDVNIKAVLLAASILIDVMFLKSARMARISHAVETGWELGHCLHLCLHCL